MKKYTSVEFGLSVEIPDGWQVLPAAWVKNMRNKASATSEELAKMLEQAQSPFLFINKPVNDPYLPIPTVQLVAKPKGVLSLIGGMRKILDTTIEHLKSAFADFQCLQVEEQFVVAGFICGYLKGTMTVLNEHGEQFACASELYILESPYLLFFVGMSGSSIEAEYPDAEFKRILRSITFS